MKNPCPLLAILFTLALFTAGCGDAASNADQQQNAQQAVLSQRAVSETGMPGITHFTEKKLMKRLYEERDLNVATFAYLADINGHLHFICDSLGYGMPYATQYSSPERLATNLETQMQGNITVPQPEPNGLFMPASAEGTWIFCATKAGEPEPRYFEPPVVVSPTKLNAVDSY